MMNTFAKTGISILAVAFVALSSVSSFASEDGSSSDHHILHTQDSTYFEFPVWMGGKFHIFQPINPQGKEYFKVHEAVEPVKFQITKFMILEVAVAVILIVTFGWLAKRVRGGGAPKGKRWNLLETFVQYIRDEIARPSIGTHDGDRFVPVLCSLFFFILGCNLMGMLPWMGSPTAEWGVTIVLALFVFGTVVFAGMEKMGFLGFFKNLVPSMDLPIYLAIPLIPGIFVIELVSLLIKHFVLSVRLMANMLAGHVILGVFMSFWLAAEGYQHFYLGPISVGATVAFSLMELFVAFLQAYIFTLLAGIFIGASVHSH